MVQLTRDGGRDYDGGGLPGTGRRSNAGLPEQLSALVLSLRRRRPSGLAGAGCPALIGLDVGCLQGRSHRHRSPPSLPVVVVVGGINRRSTAYRKGCRRSLRIDQLSYSVSVRQSQR